MKASTMTYLYSCVLFQNTFLEAFFCELFLYTCIICGRNINKLIKIVVLFGRIAHVIIVEGHVL